MSLNSNKTKPSPSGAAFSLIELLISMSILAVLMLLLTTALEASYRNWTKVSGKTDIRSDLRAATSWIRNDLAAATTTRFAQTSPVRGKLSDAAIPFFENQVIFPFEVDRVSADGNQSASFVNAVEEFSQIAFIAKSINGTQAMTQRQSVQVENPQRAGTYIDNEVGSVHSYSDACLIGYYVAYTRDSPIGNGTTYSLKLYRHFRPSGPSWGEGKALGVISAISHFVNDEYQELDFDRVNEAAIREGNIENTAFPFLFAKRFQDDLDFSITDAPQPWPSLADSNDLESAPSSMVLPDVNWSDWKDPDSSVHNFLYPDEPLIDNIIRFEATPFRRVTLESGDVELMDTDRINAHLGLSGTDWPALIAPDFLEITIGIIPTSVAILLRNEAEWIVDWETTPDLDDPIRRQIEQKIEVTKLRIPVETNTL